MQAQVFEDLCKSIWEYQPENIPTDSRDIAKMLNPKAIRDLQGTGTFAACFTDGSVAICGTRGNSIVATFLTEDHGEPTDEAPDKWRAFLSNLRPSDAKDVKAILMDAVDPALENDVTAKLFADLEMVAND